MSFCTIPLLRPKQCCLASGLLTVLLQGMLRDVHSCTVGDERLWACAYMNVVEVCLHAPGGRWGVKDQRFW